MRFVPSKRDIFLLAAFVFAFFPIFSADAGQATLTLASPTSYTDGTAFSDFKGFKLYLGTAPGMYTQSFDIGKATSYTVNGLSEGSTYYFAATAHDSVGNESGHSGEASKFIPYPRYTVTATAGYGGTVSASGSGTVSQASDGSSTISSVVIDKGGSATFTMAPGTGYKLFDVQVDETSLGPVTSYTFNNVSADHRLSALFSAATFSITASAGQGGSISPAGVSAVASGASLSYAITPQAGYVISEVRVDGNAVGAVSPYSFTNVTANHAIAASFAPANLLVNNGFEQGSLDGWINGGGITISSQASYSGAFGAKMARTGRIEQVFPTSAGKTYYVSGRVRLDQQLVAPGWGGIALQIYDSNWKQLAASPYLTKSRYPIGVWTQVKFSFVATGAQSRIVYQNFSKGEFAASADDFAVRTAQ